MTDKLGAIIGLQLFWLSFSLIGAGLLLLLGTRAKRHPLVKFVGSSHPLVMFFVSESLGMATFVPILVLGFILHWPVTFAAWLYAVAVVASIGVLGYWRQIWIDWLQQCWRRRNLVSLAWFAAVACVLITDALLSIKVGGPMISDAFVHMAKINQLAAGGHFTLADPVLGNGVVESRYHINVVLALHALGANILHLPAIDAWRYSLPFWRFFIWISMFTMAWVFTGKHVRRRWSYIVLMIVPVLYATMFFCADYPDRAVFAWVVLLILSLKLFLEKGSPLLLLVSGVLITATHPLMAVITFGFLVCLGAALVITRRAHRKQLIILGLTGLLLLVSVIITYSYPNRMSFSVRHLVLQLELRHYGPITLALPIRADPHTWWSWWLLLGSSIVGYVYMIKRAGTKILKLLLALVFVYYCLIVYNPILLAIVGDHVAPWVLNRFQEMNVFRLIAPIIGLLVVTDWIISRYKKHVRWLPLIMTVAVVVIGWAYGSSSLKGFVKMDASFDQNYVEYMLFKTLTPQLEGQRVFSNLAFQQQKLPVVIQTNVFNIPDQSASPVANMELRQSCAANRLSPLLATSDLQAAGITRIIVDRSFDPDFAARANANPDLVAIKHVGMYEIYSVPVALRSAVDRNSPCYIPQAQ